jgi:hypothetical protein
MDRYSPLINQGIYSLTCRFPKFSKQSKNQPKNCRFFHKTCEFFEVFEMTGINSSLILNCSEFLKNQNWWFFDSEVFKELELMVLLIMKYLKNWNWWFFKTSKNCPTLVKTPKILAASKRYEYSLVRLIQGLQVQI